MRFSRCFQEKKMTKYMTATKTKGTKPVTFLSGYQSSSPFTAASVSPLATTSVSRQRSQSFSLLAVLSGNATLLPPKLTKQTCVRETAFHLIEKYRRDLIL